MESEVITSIVCDQTIHILFGHSGVDHKAYWSWGTLGITCEWGLDVGVTERVKREVPPDVMGVWIRHDHVFEPAGVDLEIIVGVTPATNTGGRVVKEFGVVDVVRVWVKIVMVSFVMTPSAR